MPTTLVSTRNSSKARRTTSSSKRQQSDCVEVYDVFEYTLALMMGYYDRSVVTMLRELAEKDLFTQSDVLKMIGAKFRVKMTELPPWYTDTQVAEYLLRYSYTFQSLSLYLFPLSSPASPPSLTPCISPPPSPFHC